MSKSKHIASENLRQILLKISLVLILFSYSYVFAAGRTRAEFLRIDTGGRPAGMGGAFSAVSDDINSIFYNPAGLGWIEGTEVTFLHNAWLEGISQDYLAGTHNLGWGSIGVSINYFDLGEITGKASQIDKPYSFTARQTAATLSLGGRIKTNMAVGTSLKLIQEKIENENSSGWAVDFGIINQIDEYRFAVSAQNLGPKIKFIDEKEEIPTLFKFGIARQLENLTIAFDVNVLLNSSLYNCFGVEYKLNNMLSLRAGYQMDEDYDSNIGLTAGLGVLLGDYRLDYAYMPFGEIGITHRISIIYSFGNYPVLNDFKSYSMNYDDWYSKYGTN
ncbi:PorV/PorQ family protein [bacterium]|nr:PorV/PorQ family protein [bacterium]